MFVGRDQEVVCKNGWRWFIRTPKAPNWWVGRHCGSVDEFKTKGLRLMQDGEHRGGDKHPAGEGLAAFWKTEQTHKNYLKVTLALQRNRTPHQFIIPTHQQWLVYTLSTGIRPQSTPHKFWWLFIHRTKTEKKSLLTWRPNERQRTI